MIPRKVAVLCQSLYRSRRIYRNVVQGMHWAKERRYVAGVDQAQDACTTGDGPFDNLCLPRYIHFIPTEQVSSHVASLLGKDLAGIHAKDVSGLAVNLHGALTLKARVWAVVTAYACWRQCKKKGSESVHKFVNRWYCRERQLTGSRRMRIVSGIHSSTNTSCV